MITVAREPLSTGHWTWTHKPQPPDAERIIAAERLYRGESKPPKPVIVGERTPAHNRADRQFATVFPSKRSLVVQRVARKVPRTFVDDVVGDVFRRFYWNLFNVEVPDRLVTASLFRQVNWTVSTFRKSVIFREHFSFRPLRTRTSSAASTPDDSMTTQHEDVFYHTIAEHEVASDTPSLSEQHHATLIAAVEQLPAHYRDVVNTYLDGSRKLTNRESPIIRDARKRLAELMPSLAA